MTTPTTRVIIFTGSGSGIGLAGTTLLLSTEPTARVVAVDINGENLKPLRMQYPDKLEVIVGDISQRTTSEQAVEAAISKFGHLDAIVLNAAVLSPVGPIATAKVDEWKKLFDINFFSLLHSIQVALPHLRKTKGSVIMTSSGVSLRPHPAWIAYASSKRAMNCLCAGLTLEEPDISCLCMTPGIADTGLQKEVREKHKTDLPEHMYSWLNDMHLKGELLRPEQPGGSLAKLAMHGVPQEIAGEVVGWDDKRIV